METPVQQAARLVEALHELIRQEGDYLTAGSFDAAMEVRDRAAPVVHQLVELSTAPGVKNFGPQVNALVQRSALHAAILQEKMDELGAEIRRTDQARHRAAQLAPSYARSPGSVVPQFLAAG